MVTVVTDDFTVRKNLAANLGRILGERQLTQTALAERTGEKQATISRLLRGLHTPGAGVLTRLAEALDVSIDRLVSTPPTPPSLTAAPDFPEISENSI